MERELVVLQHLLDALFLHIQRLAPEGEGSPETAGRAPFGVAAGAVALHDEQLVVLCLAARALESLPTRGALSALLFPRSIFLAFLAAMRALAAVSAFSAILVRERRC